MRILIVLAFESLPLKEVWGHQLRLEKIVEGAISSGHEIFLLQDRLAGLESKEYVASLEASRVHSLRIDDTAWAVTSRVRWSSLLSYFLQPEKISRVIEANSIDVVDSQVPLRINFPRLILSTNVTWNYALEHLRNVHRGAAPWFLRSLLLQLSLQKANHIIVEGQNQKLELLRLGVQRGDTVKVIPPGFDLTAIGSARETTRSSTDIVISFSGRLQKSKGVLELLRVFESLSSRYPNLRLKLIGEGLLRNRIQDYLRRRNLTQSVFLTGYLDHLQALKEMADSDIFVLPSRIESFPFTLIEAMALGKPCVATHVGAIPYDIIPNAGLGQVVQVSDTEGMTAAISKYLDNPRLATEVGIRAAKHVSQFTLDAMINRTLRVYEDIGSSSFG